ncbi:unnamed protein product [Thelazia callipaeda]|uniref:CTNNB1 binding N-teminal domain-containing protein n=1 Tax=Thelazia callipaeda TaxID=103827 RepID=A0A0N5CK33_THECL|nr:unnamed protein product [Thelazia callipaeda]
MEEGRECFVGSNDTFESHLHRRAASSGESSIDGSFDEDRAALSDSDLAGAARIQTLAIKAKGPSSDALETECRTEQSVLNSHDCDCSLSKGAWNDVLGSGQLFCKVLFLIKAEVPVICPI